MSLYDIPNAPNSPSGRLTTVGWDGMHRTFFTQAWDDGKPGETSPRLVFDHGSKYREVPTIDALRQVLAEHQVQLPRAVEAALVRDQRTEGGA